MPDSRGNKKPCEQESIENNTFLYRKEESKMIIYKGGPINIKITKRGDSV